MSASNYTLAVVGLAGAGKSSVSELLIREHDFERIYFGQVVLDELEAQNLTPSVESEQMTRERLRATEGMAVMAARSLPAIQLALSRGRNVCIDGLYSSAEWELLARETRVITVAVHASRCLRKLRLATRSVRPLTGIELDTRDLAEVRGLDKAPPIALADAHIVNDGSLDELGRNVESVIERLEDMADSRLQHK